MMFKKIGLGTMKLDWRGEIKKWQRGRLGDSDDFKDGLITVLNYQGDNENGKEEKTEESWEGSISFVEGANWWYTVKLNVVNRYVGSVNV